jgi:hypothetical protein
VTVFDVKAGRLSIAGNDIGPAYSGAMGHVDNEADAGMVGLGPIPVGVWAICDPIDDPHTGPFSMPLIPMIGTEDLGRSGFMIHGDNPNMNESASHGCVVAARSIRERIWADPDHYLTVV